FKYIREIQDDHEHAYIFTAEINGLSVTGCDFLTFDEEGKIADFMVMVRPLKAAQALAAAMADRYPSIQEAAARIEETQGKWMLNLSTLLEDSARTHPDRTAVVAGSDRLSFASVERTANQVANLLVGRGIRPGDAVALSCPNLPWFPSIYYGIV